jgi:hypothetical protein
MSDFTPCWWETSGNFTPHDCVYSYHDDSQSFTVIVEADGLIQVAKDDWLSKYSLAIHQDLEVTDMVNVAPDAPAMYKPRYFRAMKLPQQFTLIVNPDLIYEGELIMHLPTWTHYMQWLMQNSQNDEDRTYLQIHFASQMPSFNSVNTMDIISAIGTAADILFSGPISALIAQAAFVIAGVNELIEGPKWYLKVESIKAAAYAATAWAFEDLYPAPQPIRNDQDRPKLRFPIPEEIIRETFLRQEYRFGDLHSIMEKWEKVSADTLTALDQQENKALDEVASHGQPRPTSHDYRRAVRKLPIQVQPDDTGEIQIGYEILTRRKLFDMLLKVFHRQFIGSTRVLFISVPRTDAYSLEADRRLRSWSTRYPPVPNPNSPAG